MSSVLASAHRSFKISTHCSKSAGIALTAGLTLMGAALLVDTESPVNYVILPAGDGRPAWKRAAWAARPLRGTLRRDSVDIRPGDGSANRRRSHRRHRWRAA